MSRLRQISTNMLRVVAVVMNEIFHTLDNVVWNVNHATLFGQVGGYGDTINTSHFPGLLWMVYRLGCVKADIHRSNKTVRFH